MGASAENVIGFKLAAKKLSSLTNLISTAINLGDVDLAEIHKAFEAIILTVIQTVGEAQFISTLTAAGTMVAPPLGGVFTGLAATFTALFGDLVPFISNPHEDCRFQKN